MKQIMVKSAMAFVGLYACMCLGFWLGIRVFG